MNINKEDYLKKGFLQMENFFSDKQFNILREFVDNKININKHKSFFLTSKTNSELDTFFQNNKVIRDKIETVIKKFNFVNENNDSFHSYKALRVIKNNRIKRQVRDFHFDSHILTILIPIYIPNRKKSENGHLMMSSKLRRQTKNIFINIFQKFLYQNKILFHLTKYIWFQKKLNFVKILLKPKSIFIFNGFTNLHGNLEIYQGDTRATFLIHVFDLFKDSKLVTFNRNLRIFKERKIINKNRS